MIKQKFRRVQYRPKQILHGPRAIVLFLLEIGRNLLSFISRRPTVQSFEKHFLGNLRRCVVTGRQFGRASVGVRDLCVENF